MQTLFDKTQREKSDAGSPIVRQSTGWVGLLNPRAFFRQPPLSENALAIGEESGHAIDRLFRQQMPANAALIVDKRRDHFNGALPEI